MRFRVWGLGLRVWGLGLRAWGLGARRNAKENGQYYNGLYRNYYKDPFLHS